MISKSTRRSFTPLLFWCFLLVCNVTSSSSNSSSSNSIGEETPKNENNVKHLFLQETAITTKIRGRNEIMSLNKHNQEPYHYSQETTTSTSHRENIPNNGNGDSNSNNDQSNRNIHNYHNRRRSLIVNGYDADPKDYPFYGKSDDDEDFYANGESLCGASLIHPDIVLSAAHCQGAFNYGVNFYDFDAEDYVHTVPVVRHARFPKYNFNNENINYDVLVMKLSEPVLHVDPIRLNNNPDTPSVGQRLVSVGFGRLSYEGGLPDTLQQARFQYTTRRICRAALSGSISFEDNDILCTLPWDNSSTCNGDSGGPLFTNTNPPVLVGVTSFGNRCNPDDIPDGFARVSYFYDWIHKKICALSDNPPDDCEEQQYDEEGEGADISGTIPMRLVFTYDWCAHHTTFAIRNSSSRRIVYVGPDYVPERGGTGISNFRLPPGEYIMEVYDSRGNGLQSPIYSFVPHGEWHLYASFEGGDLEVELASGDGLFEEEQLTEFVVIEAPTSTPTLTPLPSSEPSIMPSSSIAPSEIPSTIPTETFLPSELPSELPTPNTSGVSLPFTSTPVIVLILFLAVPL